ncbi:MAG: ABC transporter substrate-binding protein [Synergistaceae bacterium]|jgi:iron complex transport system substrate-binding protein|nr:ABC transporter substrate-binding protein [Synergistaceae bacterium]
MQMPGQFPSFCPAFGEPLQIVDDLGETVVFEAPASRIVSIYAGHTENLIAIGARGSILAIGHEAESGLGLTVPSFGARPGIERVIALSPDLVLTRPMMARAQEHFYSALKSFGVRVVALDPPSWEEFPGYIALLGKMTGRSESGAMASEATRGKFQGASAGASRKGVFLVTNGRTMATCAPDSWAAHIIEAAGFRNAARGAVPVSPGSSVASFGAERLLAADADVDVILLQQGAMNTIRAEDFMSDPRFSALRAVRGRMVFDIPEAEISRPSLLRLENGAVRSLRDLVAGGN